MLCCSRSSARLAPRIATVAVQCDGLRNSRSSTLLQVTVQLAGLDDADLCLATTLGPAVRSSQQGLSASRRSPTTVERRMGARAVWTALRETPPPPGLLRAQHAMPSPSRRAPASRRQCRQSLCETAPCRPAADIGWPGVCCCRRALPQVRTSRMPLLRCCCCTPAWKRPSNGSAS